MITIYLYITLEEKMEVLPLNAIVYNQQKVDMKDVIAPLAPA